MIKARVYAGTFNDRVHLTLTVSFSEVGIRKSSKMTYLAGPTTSWMKDLPVVRVGCSILAPRCQREGEEGALDSAAFV